jgi:neutrophil factor 2
MTVKVHYTTTRAVRVLYSIQFNQLGQIICSKFGQHDGSLTLWYKAANGELEQITSDEVLRTAIGNLEDGFRLTLWAYEKNESQATVLKEVVAVADYAAQYEDELTFRAGEKIQITLEINTEWYEGQCHGSTGIFPRSFVRDS